MRHTMIKGILKANGGKITLSVIAFLAWALVRVVVAGGMSRPCEQPAADERVEARGLQNVFLIRAGLFSGSGPADDEAFQSLQQLRVQTLISVDGAPPDLARARKFGLRYVHLPIGYDGLPREQAMRLAKAIRDLPGPVYLHCHHGKHRGPTAAVAVRLFLDETYTVEMALADLRRAGTDPRYTGLYDSIRNLRRPTSEELDRIPANFPETAQVPAFNQIMVAINERWEHLQQVRVAGWQPSMNHPDLDPAHEALQLVEHYREAARLPEVSPRRPDEFRKWLAEGEASARELEELLRHGTVKPPVSAAAAEKVFQHAQSVCARCHARYQGRQTARKLEDSQP